MARYHGNASYEALKTPTRALRLPLTLPSTVELEFPFDSFNLCSSNLPGIMHAQHLTVTYARVIVDVCASSDLNASTSARST